MEGASLEVIASTSENSWAERDLTAWEETGQALFEDDDLLGPVPVAVAGTPTAVPWIGEADQGDAPGEETGGEVRPCVGFR